VKCERLVALETIVGVFPTETKKKEDGQLIRKKKQRQVSVRLPIEEAPSALPAAATRPDVDGDLTSKNRQAKRESELLVVDRTCLI